MKVLVGCEESQVVCNAFRARGHEAYSCDIQECSGGHPEWHIHDDVLRVINLGWDLGIFHPDCTYTCWSAEWAYGDGPYHQKVKPGTLVGSDRREARAKAVKFLNNLWDCDIEKICIEQSLSHFLSRNWKKPTQTVHPYHFGDPFRKSTSLWIRGMKPLIPTNILWKREPAVHKMGPSENRAKNRAKFYPGMAAAMAEQWGSIDFKH